MSRPRSPARIMPWLIGLALIVRALVPAGWMTAAAAGGGIALVPCTGMAVPSVTATDAHASDAHGGHHGGAEDRPDRQDKPSPPCAFAGLMIAGLPGAPPAVSAPPTTAPLARPMRLIAGRTLPSAAPLPPSTGPPVA